MSKLGIIFPLTSDYKGSVEYNENLINSIESSIKQILLTTKGERPMNPEFGCNLRRLNFEYDIDIIEELGKQYITESIEEFETRVQIEDITFSKSDDTIFIQLVYSIRYSNLPLQALDIPYKL
ncbi:MAG: hypothetical protein K0Q47_154 [Sedimentibacter sp.]|jgi:phage baseplate assembly protein W|nr:hypothetical protein [Sedimentibacter sp.]